MNGDIVATECVDQINRKIMASFVNMISCNVRHFINFPDKRNELHTVGCQRPVRTLSSTLYALSNTACDATLLKPKLLHDSK